MLKAMSVLAVITACLVYLIFSSVAGFATDLRNYQENRISQVIDK